MVKTTKLNNPNRSVRSAYQHCQAMANSHYENFPVASILLPKHLRRSIAAIYAFSRTADDIADEGVLCRETRLELMTRFEANVYDLQYGKPPTEPIFIALKHTIETYNLPIQLFYDLLTAFRQDILKNRYQNFAEVKDYCHYSANPIGRLLLYLAGQASRDNLLLSDHICTGLQLVNFIQDLEIDLFDKNRCYIPLDELNEFEIDIEELASKNISANYAALIKKQLERANAIYQQGISLGQALPGFFGFEIRYIIACGQKIIAKLTKRNSLNERPIIYKTDMLWIFIKVLFSRQTSLINQEPILEKL